MKNEQKEIKLEMPEVKVIEILGEPDKVVEDNCYTTFYYIQKEPYTKREISFMEGVVISISVSGVEPIK